MNILFMKKIFRHLKQACVVTVITTMLVACANTTKAPHGSVAVRSKLSQLQSDPKLSSLAPVAINDAEVAVRAAEKPTNDNEQSQHLVWMADHKVDTALALAQSRYLEDQRNSLGEEREKLRLDARTLEADKAHQEATMANTNADMARADADAEKQKSEDLQRQITELNAKATDRGLVVTLGDLLFETGRAELKNNSINNLTKLSNFLNKYPDRNILIEGHTDSVGGDDYNMGLSQRRANSVKSYLLNQGIATNRIVSSGLGEGMPVADNTTPTGRQMNRRVEVIITKAVVATMH